MSDVADRNQFLAESARLYNAGDLPGAEAACQAGLARWPQDPYLASNLAVMLARRGAAAEAESFFRIAVNRAPKDVKAAIYYYNFLLRQGRANLGVGLMERWARHAIGDWRAPDAAPCDAPDAASEAQPSDAYVEVLRQYAVLHASPDLQSNMGSFDGILSFGRWAGLMRRIVTDSGARSMLDYGGGKGVQYQLQDVIDAGGGRHADMRAYLGVDEAICFDPGYSKDATPPGDACADLVVSIDVLEHIPVEDLRWVTRRLFHSARKAVFVVVANYPAGKFLPDGRNAHITLRPGEWWARLFRDAAAERPQVAWRLVCYNGWGDAGVYYAGGPRPAEGASA